MTTATPFSLSVERGTFAYRAGEPVLRNISMEARAGDIVAVLGPNGVGKTTFLRCMMGLLPWREGHTSLDGTDIRRIKQKERWQRIAYVPQARGAFSSYSAEEMILLGRTGQLPVFSAPGEKDLAVVNDLMVSLHIAHLRGKKCSEISGGELQMILIARALAAEPQLLVLDEPESNLDFRNQLIVLDTITRLAANGMCCVFNTHYPAHALSRANKALLLEKGGGFRFGATPEIVTERAMEEIFGVRTVISSVDTPAQEYRSILPLSLVQGDGQGAEEEHRVDDPEVLASLSMMFSDFSVSTRVNGILHTYRDCLVGRMGMPYQPDEGQDRVYIIHVAVHARRSVIRGLTGQLSVLPDISIKTTEYEPKRSFGR